MGDLRIATELPHLGGSDLLVAIGIGPGTALPPVGGHGANPVSGLPIATELPHLGGSDLLVAIEIGPGTALPPILALALLGRSDLLVGAVSRPRSILSTPGRISRYPPSRPPTGGAWTAFACT